MIAVISQKPGFDASAAITLAETPLVSSNLPASANAEHCAEEGPLSVCAGAWAEAGSMASGHSKAATCTNKKRFMFPLQAIAFFWWFGAAPISGGRFLICCIMQTLKLGVNASALALSAFALGMASRALIERLGFRFRRAPQ